MIAEEGQQRPLQASRMYSPARAASAGSWPSASRIGSVYQRIAQTGTEIAMPLHRPWRTVRRTSRTEWRRAPISRAIIGATAVTSPMPKIMKAK